MKIPSEKLKKLGLRNKNRVKLTVPENENKGNLEVKNIEFKFNGIDKKIAFKKTSLLKWEKFTAQQEQNGLGKSTLLRCLIGLERKSKDEIYLDGKSTFKIRQAKNIIPCNAGC